jgi:cephalosporin hydroxylase
MSINLRSSKLLRATLGRPEVLHAATVGRRLSRLSTQALRRRLALPAFHRLYYYEAELTGGTWLDTYWLGVPTAKCPLDLWIYQEILFERRPDVIVETGTAHGGSALYLASICDILDRGRVVTVDVEEQERPTHARITYLLGSSTDPTVLDAIRSLVGDAERVMVILDSDHRAQHVLDELKSYGELVTPGDYLVVEDTNVNGHPVSPEHGDGPMEAVNEFLRSGAPFDRDERKEKLLLTFNPRGYLRRRG